ncbi:pilus assembly protein [Rhizobacter sp. J219]|uniref:TfpX/TfpZ family type IV pilin accessory protein n=1 Tax=Rhizobacter sp. J219 TaxID=2898430 RepID=UPI002151A56C|nr:TfpX/TfpZ family type IV pilin accessory protein [Rhizobacter sp. J219]MCR5884739.1 pilus assembly protein [Rhizobacter sp. J219]
MNIQKPQLNLRPRLRAAGIHLLISMVVAALAAAMVFALWYPWPYRVVSGGQGLFVLVVTVDLVLGPLLTLAVFDTAKGWRHLRRDLAVIGALQTAALAYGVHTVYEVRPVAMVFETDRFRVIKAVDVHLAELHLAPPAFRSLPLTGPWLLGARAPKAGSERTDALFLGIGGVDVAQRPLFWQPYELSRTAALARSRPVSALLQRYPSETQTINQAIRSAGMSVDQARFLPLVARRDWVVLLSPKGDVSGYLPLDGFF